MRERDVTFDGIKLVYDLGLVYSNFEEVPPEPEIVTVDIPGGPAIDLSDAVSGSVGYGMGTHILTFLLCKDTQEERLETKTRLMALLHGRRANYSLSWVEGTYKGRASVAFDHMWDDVDLVTVTIVHDAYATSTETMTIFPGATSSTASTASTTIQLTGADSYEVTARSYTTTGTAKLGSGSAVTLDGSSSYANVGTVYPKGARYVNLTVTLNEWWVGTLTEAGNLTLNSSHFTVGEDATADSDWSLSGTDLKCASYTSKQYVTAEVKRRTY